MMLPTIEFKLLTQPFRHSQHSLIPCALENMPFVCVFVTVFVSLCFYLCTYVNLCVTVNVSLSVSAYAFSQLDVYVSSVSYVLARLAAKLEQSSVFQ